jgi:hypothetical protein
VSSSRFEQVGADAAVWAELAAEAEELRAEAAALGGVVLAVDVPPDRLRWLLHLAAATVRRELTGDEEAEAVRVIRATAADLRAEEEHATKVGGGGCMPRPWGDDMTAEQAAEVLDISRQAVEKACRAKRLRSRKDETGRRWISSADVFEKAGQQR